MPSKHQVVGSSPAGHASLRRVLGVGGPRPMTTWPTSGTAPTDIVEDE